MKVLVDTNIIIDWITVREPFAAIATKVMEECLFGDTQSYIASHTITDLFYILRKELSVTERKEVLTLLCEKMQVIPEGNTTIKKALANEEWLDLEDGLQMQCAAEEKLDFIITRNIGDFQKSEIKVVTTEEFYKLI